MSSLQLTVVFAVALLISLEARDIDKRVPLFNSSRTDNSSTTYSYRLNKGGKQRIDLSFLLGIVKIRENLAKQDTRQLLPRPAEVNEICYKGIIDFLDALVGQPGVNESNSLTTPDWALQMFDAFGKPGAGLLEGSLQLVGAYQECLDVHAEIPAGVQLGARVREHSSQFDTSYCRVEVNLDRSLWTRSSHAAKMNKFWLSKKSPELVLNWGVCVPDSCQGQDVQALLTKGTLSRLKLQVRDVVCYEKNSQLGHDVLAIIFIVVLTLYSSVVLACTALETFWHYRLAYTIQEGREIKEERNGKNGVELEYKDVNHKVQPPPTPIVKEGQLLNGYADSTKIDNPPSGVVETSVDLTSTGNGTLPKQNGVGIHSQKKQNGKDVHRPNHELVNGNDKRDKPEDNTRHYQINIACDDILEREDCRLKSEIAGGSENHDEKDVTENCLQKTKNSTKEGIGTRLVKAFSMRMNILRLLKTSRTERPGVIRCIDGIRVFSMLWIILGHTYTFGGVMDEGNLMFANSVQVTETVGKASFFLVSGATFAVDSFFLISGLLVMMLTLKDLGKQKPTLKFWGLFYFHRLWRLTPVYLVVIMFGITMYDHSVEGPLKSQPLAEFDDCHSKWWSHLLYINNLYQPRQKCMTWTWYLAVDMQLFSMAPIVIYVIHRSFTLGIACLTMLLMAGIFSAFISQSHYQGQFVLMDQVFTDYWQHVYIVPWTRIGAFAIGMFTGVFILNKKQTPTLSKPKALCVWVVVTAVALFFIFIPHNQWREGTEHWSRSIQALYEALSRPMWSLCVAWVIYSCHNKMGGIANNILSWPGFQPASRITYTVYLIHPIIMTFFIYSRNTPVFLQDTVIIYQYIGNLVLSYIFGTLLCIVFESPIQSLEKILLGSSRQAQTEDKRNISKC